LELLNIFRPGTLCENLSLAELITVMTKNSFCGSGKQLLEGFKLVHMKRVTAWFSLCIICCSSESNCASSHKKQDVMGQQREV